MLRSIILFIPVTNWESGMYFYKEIMGFKVDGTDIYPNENCNSLCINLLNCDEISVESTPSKKLHFPLFRIFIENNFLSYCKARYDKNVNFEIACEYPSGYMAKIIDPFGNTFELCCESFEETTGLRPMDCPFLGRY